MPSQIIFPCPNCGATQSVDEATVSTQCQFCGNTISVPENLRPKTAPPDPSQAAPQAYTFGAATSGVPVSSIPGMAALASMAGLPDAFLNMDVNKLRAMAMAARAGDKAEAARLYSETFGVSPDEAMRVAELMSQHHHVVLSQMPFGGSTPNIQMGAGQPMAGPSQGVTYNLPSPPQGVTYNLPSPTVVKPRRGIRWGACLSAAFTILLAVVILGVILLATTRFR